MRVTGSPRRAQPRWRAPLAGALAAAGLAGLAASAMIGPAALSGPAAIAAPALSRPAAVGAPAPSGPAVVAAPAPPGNASSSGPPSAPADPTEPSFVTQPRIASGQPNVTQACSTPSVPGQMACMALISTRSATRAKAAAARADASPPGGPAFDPADLQGAYGLASAASVAGDGETVAVVDAYNDPMASSDLDAYRSAYGLGTCDQANGCLRVLNEQGGTANLPTSDPTGGWELEESLDLDMVSAICPHCSIILVEAASASISDLAVAVWTATHSGAEAVSNSWGSGAEFTGENAYDSDFYAPGVAITAAGGDNGYGTQYPAASPYVSSVGGTTLAGAPGDWTQTAWNGTGSGCSELEPKPPWQLADDSAPNGCLNRTANDLAADADPNPGAWVYDTVNDTSLGTTGWAAVGGTSIGAPVIAAAYALADIVAGGPHKALIPGTFPAAYPYQDGSQVTDVTSGSNGACETVRQYLCQAQAGYDGPTGLGTPTGTASLTGPSGGEVTVLDPGTQVYETGAAIRLQLNAPPGAQAFQLTGLPTATVGTDGLITGNAPAAPGTNSVTVTATEAGVGSGSARFSVVTVAPIVAQHAAIGEVRLNGGKYCLTGAHFSTAVGSSEQIERCAGRSAQRWQFAPGGGTAGTGWLELAGHCLTVKPGGGNGAVVSLRRCSRRDAGQDWTYLGNGHLRDPASGRCLGVRGTVTNGRQVAIWRCGGGASTDWLLPPAPVLSALYGRCLADPADSAVAGTAVESSRCTRRDSEHWTAAHGAIQIAGMCLAIEGGSMLDGAAVELAHCSQSAAQRWLRGPSGELINANSGRCLAIPGNSRAPGTELVQDDCYSEPGEIWVIS
jgi:Ricin-type beta-trefoil lectin domain